MSTCWYTILWNSITSFRSKLRYNGGNWFLYTSYGKRRYRYMRDNVHAISISSHFLNLLKFFQLKGRNWPPNRRTKFELTSN